MHRLPPLAGLLLILNVPGFGLAAEFEEDAFFEPLPVVLTASRLPQSLADAPGAITVIDRRTLDAANYRSVERYLRAVPGLNIGHERGHSSWVSYHGTGVSTPGMMQILVNGSAIQVPANFGAIRWSLTPIFLSELEQIEVVRGASANTYGSTSLIGSTNFITRPISEAPRTSVSLYAGDAGIRDAEVSWSGRLGASLTRISLGEQRDDGFNDLHDSRISRRLSVTTETQIDPSNSLHVRLGASHERPEYGYPDSPYGSNAVRRADFGQSLISLRWLNTEDADRGWSVSFYRQYHALEDEWTASYGMFNDVPIVRDRRGWLNRLEFQRSDRPADALRLAWGASTQRSQDDSPQLLGPRGSVESREEKVFANAEWQMAPRVTLNAGMAAEDTGSGWRMNPRLFGNYTTTAGATWRLGASRVFRSSSPLEKYGDVRVYDKNFPTLLLAHPFVANPDLRETRADTLEAGLLARFEASRTTLDARVFREILKDYVVRGTVSDPAAVLGAQIPANQLQTSHDSIVLTGLELQVNTHPWRGGRFQFAWSVIDRNAPNEASRAAIAPYTANLTWQQEWPDRWSSYLSMTRVGPVAFGDSYLASERYVVRDFTTWDLSITRRLTAFGQPASFSLTALNLGPRHQEIADPAMQRIYGARPANPVTRQVYAGLALQF